MNTPSQKQIWPESPRILTYVHYPPTFWPHSPRIPGSMQVLACNWALVLLINAPESGFWRFLITLGGCMHVRHCLRPVRRCAFATGIAAKTLPLPRAPTAATLKTPPLPCVSTASRT